MDDTMRLDLAKQVLDQHFGMRGLHGDTVCATCTNTPWPCPPATLAEKVQEEVLAR